MPHGTLGHRIERAPCLVEHKDRRVAKDGTRDRESLFFASRKSVAPLPHHRVVAVRKRLDVRVDLCNLARGNHVGLARLRLHKPQVLRNASVKQVGLLRDHSDGARERVELELAHVDAVDTDSPLAHVVEA